MRWLIPKTVSLQFGVAVAILFLVGAAAYRSTVDHADATQHREQSYQILNSLNELLNHLTDMETGWRGYALTGQDSFLELYRSRLASWDDTFRGLESLTADNPTRQAQLRQIAPLIQRRIANLNEGIELRQSQGLSAAVEHVGSGVGMNLMNDIRVIIATMEREETDRLRAFDAEAYETQRLSLIFTALGVFLSILLVGLAGWEVNRDFQARVRAERRTTDARNYAEAIIATIRDPLLVLTKDLRIETANRAFYQHFQVSEQETVGRLLFELGNRQWDIPELRELLEDILSKETTIEAFEVRHEFPDIGRRTMLLNARKLYRESNNTARVVLAMEDITERKQAERDRRRAAEEIQDLYENAPCGYHSLDGDGKIVRVNETELRWLGYSREELLGMNYAELLAPTYREGFDQRFAAFKAGGVAHDREVELIRKDGSLLPVLINATAIRDASGNFLRTRSTMIDLSERRRAEAEVRASEAKFRAILEGAGSPIIGTDRQGHMVLVNKATEQLFGYSREELLGQPVELLVPERLRQKHEMERMGYQRQPRTRTMGTVQNLLGRHKDGREIPLDISLSPIETPEGQLVIAVLDDQTEHKLLEESLRKAHESMRGRFDAAIRASGNLLYEWVPDSDEVWYENSIPTIGYTSEEIGRGLTGWVQLIHPEDREDFQRDTERALREKRPLELEYRIRRKDGNYIQVRDRGYWIFNDAGEIERCVGFVTDVTSVKALEEQFRQAQKMEAIGRLAGGIAHDFNNLVGVITGYSELAMERLDPNDPAYSRIEKIKKAGERTAALTKQLLAFSRRQVLEPRVLDLNAEVEDFHGILPRLIGEDVDVSLRLSPDLGFVKADPSQIQQILMNLAVNARDAMPQGGKLTIETRNAELDASYVSHHPVVQPGPYVMLGISDTGVGMDRETQEHIFEPFFTTKEGGKGTGLGLATVYGIVKQSGGFIWVYSEPGHGTTFKIYLPRTSTTPSVAAALPTAEEMARGAPAILVMEDELYLRELICEWLADKGYTVTAPETAEEALRIAQERPQTFQLLLTDVVMPGMGGAELAQAIQSTQPEMKVLYMSGYPNEAIVHRGILNENMAFLQKPFNREQLLKKIREVLALR